jgi:phosphoheptose isomerase
VVHGPYLYDGKSYPVTGSRAYDAASYKIVNDSTDEITRTKIGKVVQTVTEVLSADGKTLTFTTTGVNANGQHINNVAVYEKQ